MKVLLIRQTMDKNETRFAANGEKRFSYFKKKIDSRTIYLKNTIYIKYNFERLNF